MSDLTIGALGLIAVLVLIAIGMRVAYAVTLVGVIGLAVMRDWGAATSFAGYLPSSVVGTYAYSVIPLFIIMGYFTYYAGVTDELFKAARAWVRHLPGGLPIATALASVGFAAVSGASTAASSVLAKIAIPQMVEAGVDRRVAAGIVANGGTLAALIPPSALMVIYGILTEQSIAAVLMAGILPGLLTAFVQILIIYIRVRLNPNLAPLSPPATWGERFRSLSSVWGVLILIVLVLGGLYTGQFTPTEAGGVGAFGAFFIALALRRLNRETLKSALIESGRTTVMTFAVMVGIAIFIRFLAMTGISGAISEFVVSLPAPPTITLIAILLVYAVLGMFMDALSMMMLTLPVFFPAIVALGFHPIWFGIIVMKMAEIALITPPVGLNCYVVATVARDIPVEDVFKGATPFLLADLVVVALLIAFPQIVLIVPELMSSR